MHEVERWDLRRLFGLRGRNALLLMSFVLGTVASMMVKNMLTFDNDIEILIGYLLIAAATVAMVLIKTEPIPLPSAILATLVGPLSTFIAYHNVESAELTHRTIWTVYADCFVLALLAIRGRVALAFVGAVLVGIVADFGVGLGIAGFSAPIVQLVIVAAAGLAAVILRPTLRTLRTLAGESTIRATAEATMRGQSEERDRQLARLDELARPMLERIAAGGPLTDAERDECRLLEAELRDGLRAPVLVTAGVAAAARGARSRGVEVLLLDDGGLADAPGNIRAAILRGAAKELDAATTGSVTVRVLPKGRRCLATILVSSDTASRRTEVDHAGNSRTFVESL